MDIAESVDYLFVIPAEISTQIFGHCCGKTRAKICSVSKLFLATMLKISRKLWELNSTQIKDELGNPINAYDYFDYVVNLANNPEASDYENSLVHFHDRAVIFPTEPKNPQFTCHSICFGRNSHVLDCITGNSLLHLAKIAIDVNDHHLFARVWAQLTQINKYSRKLKRSLTQLMQFSCDKCLDVIPMIMKYNHLNEHLSLGIYYACISAPDALSVIIDQLYILIKGFSAKYAIDDIGTTIESLLTRAIIDKRAYSVKPLCKYTGSEFNKQSFIIAMKHGQPACATALIDYVSLMKEEIIELFKHVNMIMPVTELLSPNAEADYFRTTNESIELEDILCKYMNIHWPQQYMQITEDILKEIAPRYNHNIENYVQSVIAYMDSNQLVAFVELLEKHSDHYNFALTIQTLIDALYTTCRILPYEIIAGAIKNEKVSAWALKRQKRDAVFNWLLKNTYYGMSFDDCYTKYAKENTNQISREKLHKYWAINTSCGFAAI